MSIRAAYRLGINSIFQPRPAIIHFSRSALFLLLPLVPAAVNGAPETLDQLLETVRSERAAEKKENVEREHRFVENRDQQQQLLDEILAKLAAEEERSETLREQYNRNETTIIEEEAILEANLGFLGELHGVVRQVAGDLKGIVENSVVSTELPGRQEFLGHLADSKEMPPYDDLEKLWHMLLEQMIETGKVKRFSAKVITGQGEEKDSEVIRIGAFNIVSDGNYLRYLPATGRVIEPHKQPPPRFRSVLRQLEQSESGVSPVAIDPSRGAILSLLGQTPDLQERIQQGGIVGYVIIILGALGLLVALERFVILGIVGSRIRRQLKSSEPNIKNPLGRVLKVFTENPRVDTETLGLKLDEAVLREMPRIQRGLSTLAILAAVTPLLGLLGTVTGIIETFQAITLFGTGDPRLMSGGISQALVTTVLGLVTAIPILLLHSFLTTRSNGLIQVLDERSAALVARLAEDTHAKAV